MSIFDEPKIDCHNHLLDPAHFPYSPDAWYHPVANEQGTAAQLSELFTAFGSRYATIVGPNSGYDTDNRCLLDAIEQRRRPVQGLAVVDNDISRADLEQLRDGGIIGTTMQAALLGVDAFADTQALQRDLVELGMFADVQVQGDQLVEMAPLLEASGVRVLIDHCGRPDPAAGLDQPGLRHPARPGVDRPVLRQDLRAGEVLRAAVPVGGFLALRARAAGGLHPGSVHVGVGLAVPQGPGADRLRDHPDAHRAVDPGPGRPAKGVVGHARPAVRVRVDRPGLPIMTQRTIGARSTSIESQAHRGPWHRD